MANGFGLTLTIVFFIFLIPNIFLAGYDYKETHTKWIKSPYKFIGPIVKQIKIRENNNINKIIIVFTILNLIFFNTKILHK